jgi:ATP-dependent Clp protease ATP-binding subunit ClpC
MIDNLGESGKLLLARAARISTELRHYYIGTEHLFLGIVALGDPEVRRAFAAQSVDIDEAAEAVRRRIGTGPEQEGGQMILTPRGALVLESAVGLAAELHSSTVEAPHILVALLQEGNGVAARTLVDMEVDVAAVIAVLRATLSQGDWSPDAYSERRAVEQPGTEVSTGVLEQFGRDLTELARRGELQPIIGRESEILQVIQILMAEHKANPILVGDAGVGKTAIVEGLAQLIARGNVPPVIAERHIRSIELGMLLAGTMYRGQFEERLTKLIEQAAADETTILFIDEIHTLIGTGASGAGDTLDAANILKPALSRGKLRCIGTTTYDEYRRHIQRDPALERRFQPVYVGEPSNADALEILRGLKGHYEEFHGVRILEESLVASVELGVRYIPDRRLPDKAVDIIDQACTKKRLDTFFGVSDIGGLTKDECREILARGAATSAPRTILVTADDVRRIVSTWTHIPIGKLAGTERERLLQLEDLMRRRVIGQDAALTALAKAIRKSRSGLSDPRRPVGAFLFLGPTGVGKTEVARALAEILFDDESRLIQIDMSELHDRWAISRLIGSAPGLVDSERGGQLTEAIKKQPYSVVLFDEMEKAHPEVLHLLLQLMEEGHLTDGLGRSVSFRNAVLIMTSNLGSAAISGRRDFGFAPPTADKKPRALTPAEVRNEVERELKRVLAPEFLNRIDAITVFNPLTPETLTQIAGLMLARIALAVEATPAAVKLLVEARYDPALGARPLRRTIEDLVVDPLAEMLIRGEIAETDTMVVGCRGGRLTFKKKRVLRESGGRRERPPAAAAAPPAPPAAEPAAEPAAREDWTTRLTL